MTIARNNAIIKNGVELPKGGAKMVAVFTDIVGNESLKDRLAADIRASSLSHAYIIEGARGSGKHTIARQIAAALSCERRGDHTSPLPCKGCISCRKILSGGSPDVITVGREEDKATLGVDAIRKLKNDVYIAPNDTDVKVYIIEDAHTMTIQAQNAFLLTLEEPPAYVVFFLLCEGTETLLETIRSRAPILHTEPIPIQATDEHLCRVNAEARALKSSAPSEFAEILATADGRIGTAIALLDSHKRKPILARREAARSFVRLFSDRKSAIATLQFFKTLGKQREAIHEQLSTILLCLRDLLLCKQADEPPLCFFGSYEEAHALAYRFTTPELLSIIDAVTTAIDRLRTNANVRLTLTALGVQTGLLQA